jgi:hypothetical protein
MKRFNLKKQNEVVEKRQVKISNIFPDLHDVDINRAWKIIRENINI